ncbi:KIR protein [Plasmodium coatneyi]|uniref:KIR protein n=1 Tax=Plasmodium coatneyi TaxID=208452 RepID=A0A1B1E0A7_9APIC|nr:KIR protein [Plasmodium coatneyi]ANQ08458.1 KIR protein [Plasmodium coatneyi]
MLLNLPSMNIYSELQGARFDSSDDDMDKVKDALKTYKSSIEDYDNIGYACGKAFKMVKTKEPLYEQRCSFLFFWIGSKIKGDTDGSTFNNILTALCDALQNKLTDVSDCSVACGGINYVNFKQRKEAYEYMYDHSYIKGEVDKYKSQCNKDCYEYIQGLVSNYEKVHTGCGSESPGEHDYCKKFEEKYREDSNPDKLSKLTCTVREDYSDFGLGKMDLSDRRRDQILKDVPSTEAYSKLNDPNGLCSGDNSFPEGITRALKDVSKEEDGEDGEDGEYTKILKERWCYAIKESIERDSTLSKCDRCNFLYYWIGYMFDDILDNNEDSSFQSIMDVVREQLQKVAGINGKCDIRRSNIDRTLFYQEKQVYDYTQDQQNIETKLNSTGSTCSEKLLEYLEEAAGAYNTMGSHCAKNATNSQAYCEKLRTVYKPRNLVELLRSKCKFKGAQDYIQRIETLSALPSVGTLSGTGTIVSSTLSVLGLPAVGFFLYKYKLLPSWISKKFGGGSSKNNNSRSRRRATTGRHHFDELTENGSTIGSTTTDYSTSNLSTTIDNSTLYNGQRGRRSSPTVSRGTNNRQQTQLQKNERTQRNIRYQNM